MDRRVRDSVNYNRDYQQFIQNLQKFHGSRGAFKRVPFFGGKELDLYLLYKTVTSLGGCAKVTDEKKWRDVAKCFNLPASCTNAAFSLRQYYLRYLSSYERLHFLGEDGDDNSIELRRSISSSFMQSSMNFMPYNIQDPVKKVVHGPLGGMPFMLQKSQNFLLIFQTFVVLLCNFSWYISIKSTNLSTSG